MENTKDNTNDNRSLAPIHKDNDNSFISTLEANNIGQNKTYLFSLLIISSPIILLFSTLHI